MSEWLTHQPEDTFLAWLMHQQLMFESERVGTDGSLRDYNSLAFGILRGIIGEAQEALEAAEIGDIEELKGELVDVLIFLSSVFVKAGLSPEEIYLRCAAKMRQNQDKYHLSYFHNRTVEDAIKYSRDQWAMKKGLQT